MKNKIYYDKLLDKKDLNQKLLLHWRETEPTSLIQYTVSKQLYSSQQQTRTIIRKRLMLLTHTSDHRKIFFTQPGTVTWGVSPCKGGIYTHTYPLRRDMLEEPAIWKWNWTFILWRYWLPDICLQISCVSSAFLDKDILLYLRHLHLTMRIINFGTDESAWF